MNETHYYIISGLGVDHLAFQRLNLPKNHTHLAWITNHKNESLSSYAARMAESIVHSNPIIVGLSFGGIIAQEIAVQMEVKSLILISTIKHHYEKPFYFRIARSLSILNLVPTKFFKNANSFMYWMFSLTTNEEKTLLDHFYPVPDTEYLKWAVNEILQWPGCDFNCDYVHIHSKGDRIFPIKNVSHGITVNGGHFAVYTNAEEINAVLAEELFIGK